MQLNEETRKVLVDNAVDIINSVERPISAREVVSKLEKDHPIPGRYGCVLPATLSQLLTRREENSHRLNIWRRKGRTNLFYRENCKNPPKS